MIVVRFVVRLIEILTTVLAGVGQAGIFIMFPLITADVFMRTVFDAPIVGTLEIVSALNVVVIFLCVPYVQRIKNHVNVDIVVNRFPPKVRYGLEVFTYTVGLGIFALITWRVGARALASFAVKETAMGLVLFPVYQSKMMIAVGSGVLCLVLLVDIARSAYRIMRPPVTVAPTAKVGFV